MATTVTNKDREFFAGQPADQLLETFTELAATVLWERSPRQAEIFEVVKEEILSRMPR